MPSSNEIFFSYAWDDNTGQEESREKIGNDLYNSLKKDGYQVVRDKYDLGYKGFISDFMTRIGKGKNIVVATSRKYFRSPYCMFELYEIARNSNFDKTIFSEKVFPITVEFIDFSKPAVLEDYMNYWESEFKDWDNLVKTRSGLLSAEQFQRYDKIKMVYQNFGKLGDWLADMNTLNPALLSKDNFWAIKKSIQENIDPVLPNKISTKNESTKGLPGAIKTATEKLALTLIAMLTLTFGFIYLLRKPKTPDIAFQSTSVFVHGKKGLQDMILRKQGHVIMDLKGGERKTADINENGIAYFQNLRLGDSVRLEVDFSEPYKSTSPDSVFIVNTDGRFYLPVTLQGIDKVKGVVLYNDEPLQDVFVSIDARTDTTDAKGHYEINIPEKEQKQQYTVWFNKKGFKAKSAPAYPQTGQDLIIVMEK